MEERTGFLQRPLVRALLGFLGFVVAYFLMDLFAYLWVWFFPGIKPEFLFSPVDNPFQQFADALVCLMGVGVWLVFFAQFVLPVRTFSDRLKVVDRLITYLTGGHGPAMFVENGIVRAREEEKDRKGPGVVWLDSASAAVLRTAVKFTRTVGPGVHFTESDEYIAGTADLHPLSQTIGPDEKGDQGDKDPFKATKETCPDDYEAIQKRRWETSALTRDGIEILATISVNFRIASKEREGGTWFGFNEENAQKAIRDSITSGADTSQPVWSGLPARMAADVWREYVRKFRQDELFAIVDSRIDTGLQTINAMIGKRLKQADVEKLDDFGRPVLKPEQQCLEIFNNHRRANRYGDIESELQKFIVTSDFRYQKVYDFLVQRNKAKDAEDYLEKASSREFKTLSDMGLEVQGVNLKRVMFAPEIEERIIAQWTTLWKKNAEKERDQVDRDRKLAEIAGQEEALRKYAADVTREFRFDPLPNKYEALFYLVRNNFLGVRRNSALLKRTNTEQRELSNIFSWLRDRGARG
jgi:hypothetical protein